MLPPGVRLLRRARKLGNLPPAFAFILLSACVSVDRPVRVAIEEIPSADRWRVTIHHPKPSATFVFPLTRAPFRAEQWSIVEPREGARWTLIDGADAIVLDRPAERLMLELPSDFALMEKDYRLNVPFTEGSRLLYTGHFRSRQIEVKDVPPHRFAFFTTAGRAIRTVDSAGMGRGQWSRDDDTYAYFGPIRPESSERMTLIVDPGLPPWIERQMRELVPRLFDFYAERLGAELPFRPLIVVSYGGAHGSGRTFSGGGLQGMLEMGVSGPQWMPQSPAAEREWFRHLAHEVFHLWGAQATAHADEAEWLSEASAEYAAMLAMLDAALLDEEAARRSLSRSARECVDRLGGVPLRDSLGPGQSRNVYTCGVVTQKIVDTAARAAESDIWSVWRRTYGQQKPYDTSDFIAAARAIAGERAAAFVEELALRGMSSHRLTDQLQTMGLAPAPKAP